MAQTFTVEIAYADLVGHQYLESVDVPAGVTIRGTIERARLLDRFPEIDLTQNKVGIFGRVKSLDELVEPGERVEIYQALQIDPKQSRRERSLKSN